MNSKVSFFSALAGTCSGIAVFHRLRSQSWVRTIFHMVLMGIFCALLITWGEIYRQRPVFQAGVKIFESVFGKKILNSPRGLIPGKSPETERFLLLPNEGRLWYFPAGKINTTAEELDKNAFLIFWAPRGFATAIRSGSGSWTVNSILPGGKQVKLSGSESMTTQQLLKLELKSREKWELDGVDAISVDNLSKTFFGIWTMTLWGQNMCLTLILPVLYTAIFVGMFRLTSNGRYPIRLSYQEFWKIGIYAGFPGMLVASAFPALALPLFSFSTVYMAGLLIYWLYSAGRLERELFVEESDVDGK